ncbi:MAG: aminotransferase class III-fold pyridoxal phosphate-dependent enzyme, partial [Lachnospiraceae bacterium]
FKAQITDDTIAIMLEPIQGEGGVIPATKEFLTGIRKLCDEKGLLLLLDEVQTGWCRTGTVMAFMKYGIKPDIVSMAKAMGGGMPIAAICASKEAATAFGPGTHGSTYGGSPVCCAAAYAEISELLDRKLAENAEEVGNYFMAKLKTLPDVKEVRGSGLLVGVEFNNANAVDVKHHCLDKKLLITAIGDHVIRMASPLIATKEDCDKAYDIIKSCL